MPKRKYFIEYVGNNFDKNRSNKFVSLGVNNFWTKQANIARQQKTIKNAK